MTIASNYALRLPASLKRELEAVARDDGTSLNQFIVTAVAEKLATLRTADFFAEHTARADRDAALAIMDRVGGEAPRENDRIG
uniref:YlcI/YnfO family protein n=1 Tax=Sphingomonas sp. TaxID=28214 RepID=UPI0025FB987A|nr:YlcI/YnfO family protein [Sphingomonas sp.]